MQDLAAPFPSHPLIDKATEMTLGPREIHTARAGGGRCSGASPISLEGWGQGGKGYSLRGTCPAGPVSASDPSYSQPSLQTRHDIIWVIFLWPAEQGASPNPQGPGGGTMGQAPSLLSAFTS